MTPSTTIEIPMRLPFDADGLLEFLAKRAVVGVETVDGRTYARSIRLPSGPGTMSLIFPDNAAHESDVMGENGDAETDPAAATPVTMTVSSAEPSDIDDAVRRCRHLIDADADPTAIIATLLADPLLAPAVRPHPGVRVPGTIDGPEILIRALIGQQVSVAAARTALGRLTAAAGETIDCPIGGITHLFPSAGAIAMLGAGGIGGPRRRAHAIVGAATDIHDGILAVTADRCAADLTAALVARPGIGPWTAGYVCMRVLADRDVLLTGDLALRRGATTLGLPDMPGELAAHGERWAPFRSYAGMYLWRASATAPPSGRR